MTVKELYRYLAEEVPAKALGGTDWTGNRCRRLRPPLDRLGDGGNRSRVQY